MSSLFAAFCLAATVVGTWNGNWFPSGRAEHRANPHIEDATITATAQMLRRGLDAVDPAGTNDVILCLHEMRGPRVVSNLVERIGRKGLRVASVSGYRRRDRFDMQQDAIATTLPVVASGWRNWSAHGRETPPRGFAFAFIVTDPAVTTRVYAVHLKSNYGATTPEIVALNRAKRTHAVREMLKDAGADPVIVAGDFNADKWRKEFAKERIFVLFEEAGCLDLLGLLPPDRRGTYPHKRYGDSSLDYIMVRGFESLGEPRIFPSEDLSDHCAFYGIIQGNLERNRQ